MITSLVYDTLTGQFFRVNYFEFRKKIFKLLTSDMGGITWKRLISTIYEYVQAFSVVDVEVPFFCYEHPNARKVITAKTDELLTLITFTMDEMDGETYFIMNWNTDLLFS